MKTEIQKTEPEHWLVKHARENPLGSHFDRLEDMITHMFKGALQQTAKKGLGQRARWSDFVKLIAAEEEAQKVIANRRALAWLDAAAKEAA